MYSWLEELSLFYWIFDQSNLEFELYCITGNWSSSCKLVEMLFFIHNRKAEISLGLFVVEKVDPELTFVSISFVNLYWFDWGLMLHTITCSFKFYNWSPHKRTPLFDNLYLQNFPSNSRVLSFFFNFGADGEPNGNLWIGIIVPKN